MTLPLTREMLASMYDYLRTTPPFRSWKLPARENIVFRIVKDPARRGHYRRDARGRHEIAVSSASIAYTSSLADVMAHEMIHLREDVLGTLYKTRAEHSDYFRKQAVRVCKFHGFDPKLFC